MGNVCSKSALRGPAVATRALDFFRMEAGVNSEPDIFDDEPVFDPMAIKDLKHALNVDADVPVRWCRSSKVGSQKL